MLLWLTQLLQEYYHGFQVFEYITFRAILAALSSLTISLVIGPGMIKRLSRLRVGQSIRDDGPESHIIKQGTPTMGGGLILVSILISSLLWGDLSDRYLWIVLLVTLGFGLIGGFDDYRKLVQQNSKGLPPRWKLFWQVLIGATVAIFLFLTATHTSETQLVVPFFKHVVINLGIMFPFFALFVIVGSSNAVNLTDGLDGLAILPTVLVAGALGIFAYLTGNYNYAHYLSIPFVPGVGEVAIFCGSLVGAGLGFLWFNAYPAQIFMGDIGSLGLGAALGVVAVVVRQELVLMIMGGLFVIETVSVIMQVASFKLTGKRIFRMAPIHHHFELKGWPEPKIIVRFWIITVILVLLGLATLKLR